MAKVHWLSGSIRIYPDLSRVNQLALVLAEGGALALATSCVVRLELPNEEEPEQMLVGAMPADAAVLGAIVGFCRVGQRPVSGRTVAAWEVDDVAVIDAFPLLGMLDELLDRCVVGLQRRGHEGVRLSFQVVPQHAAPQHARRMGWQRKKVVFGRDLMQGT